MTGRRGLVIAALALVPVLAWSPSAQAAVSPSTTFSTDTRAFTVADGARVGPYRDNLWTLSPQQSGGRYDPANLSVSDGWLRMRLHDEAGAYVAMDADHKGSTYGTISTRIRVTGDGDGWGLAVLLWPVSDKISEGEVDVAEGDLDKHIHHYVHATGSCRADGYCPNVLSVNTGKHWHGTHTVKVVWTPAELKFYVDGHRTARLKASDQRLPSTPHRLVVQTGREGTGKAKDSSVYVDFTNWEPYR